MATTTDVGIGTNKAQEVLSLFQLLDPEVLANPYPLYEKQRQMIPCTGILFCTRGS